MGAGPRRVGRMYVGRDRSLTGAEGRSVLAHLIDLNNRGLVRAEGELWTRAA